MRWAEANRDSADALSYVRGSVTVSDQLLLHLCMSRYELFDRSRLEVKPLAERVHDLQTGSWLRLDDPAPAFAHPDLAAVADRLCAAREAGAARILMMGAHVLRAGVSRHIIDLVEGAWIDHLALN